MGKKTLLKLTVVVVVLLASLAAIPVMAAPPANVHIEVPTTVDLNDVDYFTASGPAVAAGTVCAAGEVTDGTYAVSGPPGGAFRNIRGTKTFTCDDGSGTFDVYLNIRLDVASGYTTARWRVVGGTGAYAGLHGVGSLAGTPIVYQQSILDVYDGRVH